MTINATLINNLKKGVNLVAQGVKIANHIRLDQVML